MTSSQNAADRVRPFLQAMERSISAARQRRLVDQHAGRAETPPAVSDEQGASPDGQKPRLRAKAKRTQPLPNYDNPTYRSQAG